MGRSNLLRTSDMEAAFCLEHECRELWADTDAWQTHLLRGACRLTGTTVGHYNEQRLAPDLSSTDILEEADCGWRDPAARESVFRIYSEHPNRATFFPKCTRVAGDALVGLEATVLRPNLSGDDEWYRSTIFNDYHRPAYVDGFILSFALNRQTGSLVMLAMYQDTSDRSPNLRGKALLSLLARRIAPLVGTVLATRRHRGLRGLSPRLRQTLDALLAGASEKEIATQLGLRSSTVHDYVGTLYRHFNVTSRAELMAFFLRRQPELSTF